MLNSPDTVPDITVPRITRRWFWLLLSLHVLVWSLVPFLTEANASLDVVELLYTGHEWQLGDFRNPPLPSWIAEATYRLSGGGLWAIYLMAQIAGGACLWSVWRLGLHFVSARAALLAALLLETSWWHTAQSFEFNDAVCVHPLWILAILFLYRALTDGRGRYWIGTGAILGAGMLAKYTTAVLAVTILVFVLAHPNARRSLRRTGPYLACLLALLIFLPHLVWAASRGFPTIDYALRRTRGTGLAWDHLLNPLAFVGNLALFFLPAALVLAAVLGLRWRRRCLHPDESFKRDFLTAMVLGPPTIYVLLSLFGGLAFRPALGSQLGILVGLLALFLFRSRSDREAWFNAWIRLAVIAFAMIAVAAGRGLLAPYAQGKGLRVHFPGRLLAERVDETWHSRHRQPLSIVGGEAWLAGNAALYGPTRLRVYGGSDLDSPDMSSGFSPWLQDEDLRRCGAVILWRADSMRGRLPGGLQTRFPGLELLAPLELPWQTSAPLRPVRVGIALIPPSATVSCPKESDNKAGSEPD